MQYRNRELISVVRPFKLKQSCQIQAERRCGHVYGRCPQDWWDDKEQFFHWATPYPQFSSISNDGIFVEEKPSWWPCRTITHGNLIPNLGMPRLTMPSAPQVIPIPSVVVKNHWHRLVLKFSTVAFGKDTWWEILIKNGGFKRETHPSAGDILFHVWLRDITRRYCRYCTYSLHVLGHHQWN